MIVGMEPWRTYHRTPRDIGDSLVPWLGSRLVRLYRRDMMSDPNICLCGIWAPILVCRLPLDLLRLECKRGNPMCENRKVLYCLRYQTIFQVDFLHAHLVTSDYVVPLSTVLHMATVLLK